MFLVQLKMFSDISLGTFQSFFFLTWMLYLCINPRSPWYSCFSYHCIVCISLRLCIFLFAHTAGSSISMWNGETFFLNFCYFNSKISIWFFFASVFCCCFWIRISLAHWSSVMLVRHNLHELILIFYILILIFVEFLCDWEISYSSVYGWFWFCSNFNVL